MGHLIGSKQVVLCKAERHALRGVGFCANMHNMLKRYLHMVNRGAEESRLISP